MNVIKLVGGPLDGRLVEFVGELPMVYEGPADLEDAIAPDRPSYLRTGETCPDSGLPTFRFIEPIRGQGSRTASR